jgi:hypothetical protein
VGIKVNFPKEKTAKKKVTPPIGTEGLSRVKAQRNFSVVINSKKFVWAFIHAALDNPGVEISFTFFVVFFCVV